MSYDDEARFARFRSYVRVLAEGELAARYRRRIDASDLVQETLLQAWRDRKTFRGTTDEQFAAWLRSILAHTILNAVRDNRREKRDVGRERSIEASLDTSTRTLEIWLAARSETPSAELRRIEEVQAVADAIADLPDSQREAVVMKHFGGLSLKEISEVLDTTPGAAGLLVHRGLTAIRKRLGPGNGE